MKICQDATDCLTTFSNLRSKVENTICMLVLDVTNSVGWYETVSSVSPLIVPYDGFTLNAEFGGCIVQLYSKLSFSDELSLMIRVLSCVIG